MCVCFIHFFSVVCLFVCLFVNYIGQEDYDRLRPLSYPGTDVFVLMYSIISPSSLANIKSKWYAEIKKYADEQRAPIILVGTKSDLMNDTDISTHLAKRGEHMISNTEGQQVATEIGAVAHFQCSAFTQENIKNVFDTTIRTAAKAQNERMHVDTTTCSCVIS